MGAPDAENERRSTRRWTAAARRGAALVLVAASIAASIGAARGLRRGDVARARCGPGFVPTGPRCAVPAAPAPCPAPLVAKPAPTGVRVVCDAPEARVLVPAASFALGPSDWEAEGRVAARVVRTAAFRIDAFEASRGLYEGADDDDAARAASGMTRGDAAQFCARRGGRLPREDEWIAAAASATNPARRYPWGDTGAVCRRAAWGLATGPCAIGDGAGGAVPGPDTVGAHPDGDSLLGVHDLAGNVAEWVAPEPGEAGSARTDRIGVAKGGSWQSALAADLRIWSRLELDPGAHDPRVGVRCVFPE